MPNESGRHSGRNNHSMFHDLKVRLLGCALKDGKSLWREIEGLVEETTAKLGSEVRREEQSRKAAEHSTHEQRYRRHKVEASLERCKQRIDELEAENKRLRAEDDGLKASRPRDEHQRWKDERNRRKKVEQTYEDEKRERKKLKSDLEALEAHVRGLVNAEDVVRHSTQRRRSEQRS